ncbi:MAG: methylated-DNA--[protein]-cysteine S-methyltransferase [Cyclobacteriaceae bacterium]|nr:methylated-DNA--[protein]-cysteine S-methyltransferase [Cyclobacteriaceae bacterium]
MKPATSKITIHTMSSLEFESGLDIHYSIEGSPFGEILIASTHRGICCMEFIDDTKRALAHLQSCFPYSLLVQQKDVMHKKAADMLSESPKDVDTFHLHLKGTDFQMNVWNALLQVPCGHLVNYGTIAKSLGQPTASRAVGNAIAHNPVAYLIPCHRVIPASGKIGNFKWGTERKSKLILWELKSNSE